MRRSLVFAAALALAACAADKQGLPELIAPPGDTAPPGRAAPQPLVLDGTAWRLFEIGGAAADPDVASTLEFAGGRVTGSGGCNRFGGAYTLKDGMFAATGLVATKMACPGPAMGQESAFFAALDAATSAALAADGVLVLTGRDGVVLRFRPA